MAEGAHAALRAGTRAEHERLDALMSTADLSDRDGYRRFLLAHAAALPAVEAALDAAGFGERLADWPERRRTAALAADLSALGAAMPEPLPLSALATPAAQWGAAYVVEGSRVGGAFLARQVGDGLPRSYLGTPQPKGSWRRFLDQLDSSVTLPQDVAVANEAATAVFELFERAARRMELS